MSGKALHQKAQHHTDGCDARTAAQLHLHIQTATEGSTARLAQSVERKALNLVVVGSSPTVGVLRSLICSTAYANTHTVGLSLLSAWAL